MTDDRPRHVDDGRDERRPVPRLDLAGAGRGLEVVGPLPGGAVGAGVVRHVDGHESVLTWAPAPPPDHPQLFDVDVVVSLMGVARAVGNPVPRYEEVIPLSDGRAAVLQERADGVAVDDTSPRLVDHAVELALARADALPDVDAPPPPAPLFLRSSGPGFCHHDTLRMFDPATRSLLERVEAVGAELGDSLPGTDLVHYDYTLANVLVARDDPDRIVAIVDWGGAGRGDVTIDLVVLAFDLSWRAPALSTEVATRAATRAPPDVFTRAWAHVSLRLVDWAIRHDPDMVPWWIEVSRRHL